MSQQAKKTKPIALDGPVRDRAEESGRLMGQAQMHGAAGKHLDAATMHLQRGQLHEKAGEHERASASYKAAADAFSKHIEALNKAADCKDLTPDQIRAWHARENSA